MIRPANVDQKPSVSVKNLSKRQI